VSKLPEMVEFWMLSGMALWKLVFQYHHPAVASDTTTNNVTDAISPQRRPDRAAGSGSGSGSGGLAGSGIFIAGRMTVWLSSGSGTGSGSGSGSDSSAERHDATLSPIASPIRAATSPITTEPTRFIVASTG